MSSWQAAMKSTGVQADKTVAIEWLLVLSLQVVTTTFWECEKVIKMEMVTDAVQQDIHNIICIDHWELISSNAT